jgi:hypothetical protein
LVDAFAAMAHSLGRSGKVEAGCLDSFFKHGGFKETPLGEKASNHV